MGPDGSDTVDLKIDITTDDTNLNKWEIKVAQIPCNSMYSPPEGCAQWFTGATGQIRSLNFAGNNGLLATKYVLSLVLMIYICLSNHATTN